MNDFEKMSKMVDENLDIRCSTTLVEAKKVKAGGEVTIGVDEKTLMDIFTSDDYAVILYVVNKKEFDNL